MGFHLASAIDLLVTAAGIAGYGLLVNASYRVLSERIMFATKAEQRQEEALEEAREAAESATEEAREAAELAADQRDAVAEQTEASARAAEETEEAVEVAKEVIEKERTRGFRVFWRNSMYIVLAPVMIFGFFLLLSGALLFLTSTARTPVAIFTLAMAVILAVRVTAYISPDTSYDLAKMLPLALLGFFLLEGGFADVRVGLDQVWGARTEIAAISSFLLLVVAVEYALRVAYFVVRRIRLGRWVRQQARQTG